MTGKGSKRPLTREQMTQGAALAVLLFVLGMGIAGPWGLLAWSESAQLLEERKAQIAELATERDRLANLTALLDPNAADPDLVGELLRSNLNVMHEDEIVLTIDIDQP